MLDSFFRLIHYISIGIGHSNWRNLTSHLVPPLCFTEMGLKPRKARQVAPCQTVTQKLSEARIQVSQFHLGGSQPRAILPLWDI